MKIGDRFWVSNYFVSQDIGELVEFEIVEVFDTEHSGSRDMPWVKYGARTNHEFFKTNRIHYFGEDGSPDVMGARLYKNEYELSEYKALSEDYERRREEAMKIFPEGFE